MKMNTFAPHGIEIDKNTKHFTEIAKARIAPGPRPSRAANFARGTEPRQVYGLW